MSTPSSLEGHFHKIGQCWPGFGHFGSSAEIGPDEGEFRATSSDANQARPDLGKKWPELDEHVAIPLIARAGPLGPRASPVPATPLLLAGAANGAAGRRWGRGHERVALPNHRGVLVCRGPQALQQPAESLVNPMADEALGQRQTRPSTGSQDSG